MQSPNEFTASEESLEARMQVAFPRALGISEFEKLFEYVTDKIKGELRYSFEGYGNIGRMFPSEKEEPRRREKYLSKLTGTITARTKFPRSLHFSAKHDNNYHDFARISGIQFECIGFDDDEIPSEELELMDSVKQHIRKYFEYTEE